jgi:lipoprotein-anchoring transpeptidase ErfK/SrfK
MRANSHLGVGAFLLFVLAMIVAAIVGALPPRDVAARSATVNLRPGTTIVEIAYQWQTTPETIRWLNDMDKDDLVWGGMIVRVPPQDGMIAVKAEKGDTAATLAARSGVPLAMLVELNKIGPTQRLKAGQWLYVRSKKGLLASSELPTHTVHAGDTLGSIATKYRSSERLIRRYNGLGANDKPDVGQLLVIPPLSPQDRLGEDTEETGGLPQLSIGDIPSLTEKWIDVDLSEQRVVAYQGTRPLKSFLISSGKDATPTLKGVFRVTSKVPTTRMMGGSVENGDYYNLANVQWVTYFYGGYSFHGTYWHKNFGHPMSHGCINMTNDDAKWIYDWTRPTHTGKGRYYVPEEVKGTLVVVHD